MYSFLHNEYGLLEDLEWISFEKEQVKYDSDIYSFSKFNNDGKLLLNFPELTAKDNNGEKIWLKEGDIVELKNRISYNIIELKPYQKMSSTEIELLRYSDLLFIENKFEKDLKLGGILKEIKRKINDFEVFSTSKSKDPYSFTVNITDEQEIFECIDIKFVLKNNNSKLYIIDYDVRIPGVLDELVKELRTIKGIDSIIVEVLPFQ